MKKKIFFSAVLILLINGFTYGQFTKGGTYKNYEKYHITYDTIKTTRTVSSPAGQMEKAGYFFFNVGPAIPLAHPFTNRADISTPTSYDYAGIGGLGGSTGFDIGLGGMYGIPGINKHLIPQIDLAVYQSGNFTYLPWSYKNLGSPFDTWDYNGFMAISTCIGPAVIINPIRGTDLHIDVAYRAGLGVTFGGGFEDSGSALIERDEVGFTFYHGPVVNFRYSLLLVGFEFSFLGDYGSMYASNSSTYLSNAVPLNNFAIKLGIKL